MGIRDFFVDNLPGDNTVNCTPRSLTGQCYAACRPQVMTNSVLRHSSENAIISSGLSLTDFKEELPYFLLQKLNPDWTYYCQRYAGHQFGNWAGQLGDGRAHNLGEVLNEKPLIISFQLKGSGKTPFSRRGDGKAVLRSSIREYLCAEAMHHLGIPTTRSLYLATTGEMISRDMLYDGHVELEPGAIICRTAPSFIRFGSFQILAADQNLENLKILTDYTISQYFSHLKSVNEKEKYVSFFREVADSTLDLVVEWYRVGFVHGVMNTDNMSIHGITLDYGPYGWLDDYNPDWTPNITDSQVKRYRFGNQPHITMWNLVQLANSLYPLIKEEKPLQEVLDQLPLDFAKKYKEMMATKLGLESSSVTPELLEELEKLMTSTPTDMTIFYRELSDYLPDQQKDLVEEIFSKAIYSSTPPESLRAEWKNWFGHYDKLILDSRITPEERILTMKKNNPKYIFRNYMAQMTIEAASDGDYSLLEEMYQMLLAPYDEQPEYQKWYSKRPDWAIEKIGSSMLSCSS